MGKKDNQEKAWDSVTRSPEAMKMMAEGLRRSSLEGDMTQSPIVQEVMRNLGPQRTVLDIGAGVGRFAAPLAEAGCRVIALEPSLEMQGYLHRTVDSRQLSDRVRIVHEAWPTKSEYQAEVALAAFVIQFSEDPVQFVRAMEQSASIRCILGVHVDPMFNFASDLWAAFHPNQDPPRMPILADLYPKLLAQGIAANVEIVTEQHGPRLSDKGTAFSILANRLQITDDETLLQRLRIMWQAHGEEWMKPRPMRTAILSWKPDSAQN